jgi:alpha-beta hydrolase superfamily lysophospholipase
MQERDVEVGAGGVRLHGTLAVPDEPEPRAAVLFLHGSGPLDRDENMPGQRLDVFNTLARHFAGLGIASLRYDKRGCGRSTGDYITAGQDDLKADADACLRHLAETFSNARLCMVGHSEGTLLAARLSLERQVDGLVLISPFLSRIEDLLMMQARSMEAALRETRGLAGFLNRSAMAIGLAPTARQRRLIRRLRATSAPTFRHHGRPIEARSLRDLLLLDPAEIYSRVRTPMLLIAGQKDIQCDPRDGDHIASIAGSRATAVTIPNLTHILRRDPDAHTFASYAKLLSLPVDPEVLRLSGDWLAAS